MNESFIMCNGEKLQQHAAEITLVNPSAHAILISVCLSVCYRTTCHIHVPYSQKFWQELDVVDWSQSARI